MEHTISANHDCDSSFSITSNGAVTYGNSVNVMNYAVRPVFYLKSSVKLFTGENIDGSVNHPYKISWID